MSGEGRIKKTFKNIINGMAYRVLTMLTAFLVRTVFIQCLSDDYLSVSGLYSSILSMLSLAELGFSTAMVYSMYKPLAENDYHKLAQIMNLFGRVYKIIGTVIFVLGLCLVPFLDLIIKNKPDIPYLTFYYILYLLNSAMSYWFWAYRNTLLQADQKAYIISNYNSIFSIIKAVLQVVLLLLFGDFTIYLLIEIFCTIMQNICISNRVKKEYPVFGKENTGELPQVEKQKIFQDVKALVVQKISFKVLNTSDSLIISAFVGVGYVGLLSNYIMIEEAIVAVLSQIISALTASMGNYFAKESKEDGYKLFKRIEFMNFWLYGFSTVAFIVLLNPFVELWLGGVDSRYVLSQEIVIALIARFFVEGYINIMAAFRSTLGLFTQGQYTPLIVVALNIFFSIGLSFPFGVAGVLIATPLARCSINVWYMPYIIHKEGFGKSVKSFYGRMLVRTFFLICLSGAMYIFSKQVVFRTGVTVTSFSIMAFLVSIVSNIIFVLVFGRTQEYKYFWGLVKARILSGKLPRNQQE